MQGSQVDDVGMSRLEVLTKPQAEGAPKVLVVVGIRTIDRPPARVMPD